MPALWLPDSGGVSRKQKEIWLPDAGGVKRKQKELWAPDTGGVKRKIFSGGVQYSITTSATSTSDWGSASCTVNSDGSGKVRCIENYIYNNTTFLLEFIFNKPILKESLRSEDTFFSLNYNYDAYRLLLSGDSDGEPAHGAPRASLYINDTDEYAFGSQQLVESKRESNQTGIKTVSWSVSQIPASKTTINSIIFVGHAYVSARPDYEGGYFNMTWATKGIYLVNKWIDSKIGTISLQ